MYSQRLERHEFFFSRVSSLEDLRAVEIVYVIGHLPALPSELGERDVFCDAKQVRPGSLDLPPVRGIVGSQKGLLGNILDIVRAIPQKARYESLQCRLVPDESRTDIDVIVSPLVGFGALFNEFDCHASIPQVW